MGFKGIKSFKPLSFFIESPVKNQGNQYRSAFVKTMVDQRGGDFLNPQQLEITDIFKSAYLLCSGADFDGIRFKENGKRIALFMIKGDNLAELDKDYRSGQPSMKSDRPWCSIRMTARSF